MIILYYVYSYTPEKVYVTRQGSKKIELLENVSEEFKNKLQIEKILDTMGIPKNYIDIINM